MNFKTLKKLICIVNIDQTLVTFIAVFFLDLCTKLAFPDTDLSMGTMKKYRDLAGHFVMSSQASETLRIKQGAKPVNVVQDVQTRWWSTYSMLVRMLHLKQYIILMVRKSLLLPTINLTNEQWMIVEDVCAILAPFKFVQKIMEGEKYVTVSLIPGIIYTKIL